MGNGVCWQYTKKLETRDDDIMYLKSKGYDIDVIDNLKVGDLKFANEPKDIVYDEVKDFIKRYEWLGRMSLYPTHIFTARFDGMLCGVIVMDMPTAFSKMLGENTRKYERLISRGASTSWSPKNLASSLMMFAIKYMTKVESYKLFTAYSDPEASELGTIYQACNFYYLGQKFGTRKQYKLDNGRWVSDRYFRSRSVYKRMASKLGIVWESDWQTKDRVHFDNMPESVSAKIKEASKEFMKSCDVRCPPLKHKYAYVLGKNRRETKKLRKYFEENNKTYKYPKQR